MVDMRKTIIAKSDQLNADDLMGGAVTITITGVSEYSGEQPIAIHYEGDNGKPWKPCKTARRLLVAAWGGEKCDLLYRGRRLTIYRDPEVKFGGDKVGGIRISHMSDIDKEETYMLQVTRGKKKPFTVKPLPMTPEEREASNLRKRCTEEAGKGSEALKAFWLSLSKEDQRRIAAHKDSCKTLAEEADERAAAPPEPEPTDIYSRKSATPPAEKPDGDARARGERLLVAVTALRDLGDEPGAQQLIADNNELLNELENVEEMGLINAILGD